MGTDRRMAGAVLLFLGGIAFQISYTGLAIVLPLAGKSLGASPPALGAILAAFPLGVALFSLPAGAIAHRFTARTTVLLGLAILGGAGVLASVASTTYELGAFRAIAGVGGGLFWVPAIGLLSQYYLTQSRAVVIGLFVTSGVAVGGTLGLVGGEVLGVAFGWRAVLLSAAILALVMCLICRALLPPDPVGQAASMPTPTVQAVADTLRSRSTWGLALGLTGVSSAAFVAIGFVSTYFLAVHPSWGLVWAATVAAAAFLMTLPGSVVGGWASEQGADRRYVGAVFVVPFAFLFFLIPFATEFAFVVLFGTLGFLYGALLAIWFTMPSHLAGANPRRVAVDVGLINTAHLLSNAGFAVVFGIVVVRSGYAPAWEFFALLALIALPALLLIAPNRAAVPAPPD